jgi:molybdopterin-dependent oxidoreductase alpha subunit
MSQKPYKGAAGGWGALASTTKHLLKSHNVARNIRNLLHTNQDHGFDCPGCAWGEKAEKSHFKFCENGAKAVNWEATSARVSANFFAEHSVAWLKKQTDYFLEYQGRLAQPMLYNAATDHYHPTTWQAAFSLIAEQLNALQSPHQAEFYTSGRASNEAAFLYQLFVRKFGTNNLPDCSNMCHEASGVALKQAIGVGKGTVTIEDFDHADAIFVFGQNPGTNHPRMLDALSKAARRGAQIVSFNPLKERGLERFTNPQSTKEMLTGKATTISSQYFTPNLGGDMAVVRGIVKHLLSIEQQAKTSNKSIFDHSFIAEHTENLTAYLTEVEKTQWTAIVEQSGLSKAQIINAAEIYKNSERIIITWAMGITQHKHSVATIQEITNLQLLFGQLGKTGAGLCPVRGHSNVQGDRTMGINEKPEPAFLAALANEFNFTPPTQPGHNTVQAIQAMASGKSKVFIALGGNFAAATPDSRITEQALSTCELTVHIATKLNRSHCITGKQALILPCLGRTDIDRQATGEQKVTVEDSFSMVHASQGVVASEQGEMRSEPAIIAGIANATLKKDTIDWLALANNYDLIRDLISRCIPGFNNMNQKIKHRGGFYLGNSARERIWQTPNKKAHFFAHTLPASIINASQRALTQNKIFVLQTLRSHDQYNTTIYGFNDRYRGLQGDRNIILMHPQDIIDLGFNAGEKVDIESLWPDAIERKIKGFSLVTYDIPKGNCAAYFPEANPLVAMASVGDLSDTPTSKSIAVIITKHNSNRLI